MHHLSRECQRANNVIIEMRKHTLNVIFQQFGKLESKIVKSKIN